MRDFFMKKVDFIDNRRKIYLENWFIEKIIPIILLLLVFFIFAFGFIWASDYHWAFKTIQKGEITLLENQETIYVPKGAYILGEAHLYGADDDVVFDDIIPENQETDREQLVRTSGEVVIYWSLDQKVAAKMLLDD
jgi:hypothetical protein